jgi:hypothetical protein
LVSTSTCPKILFYDNVTNLRTSPSGTSLAHLGPSDRTISSFIDVPESKHLCAVEVSMRKPEIKITNKSKNHTMKPQF